MDYSFDPSYEEREERESWDRVRALLAEAAGVVAGFPYMWHIGDGEGGGLFVAWEDALAKEGFVPHAPLPGPKRKPTKAQTQLKVYRRDGFRCVECGTSDDLTVDHVIPVVKGGPHTLDNMQTLCGPCNSRKGDR